MKMSTFCDLQKAKKCSKIAVDLIGGITVQILLDKTKKFYKANLHCHSTYSDGSLTVEQLKEEYKKRGYSVVAFTDHEILVDNSRLNDEDFLAITACEVAIKELAGVSTLVNQDMKVTHLNLYSLDPHKKQTPFYSKVYCGKYIKDNTRDLISFEQGDYQRTYSPEGINKMIADARKKGFIVSYNHPNWSLESAADYINYEGMFAVEIYNSSVAKHYGLSDDEAAFDCLLRAGKNVFCTAADDNHNAYPFDHPMCASFGGWVCINAERLEYGEIMTALQNGDFYASTGPEILSLTREGNAVTIECSAAKRIVVLANTRHAQVFCAEGGEGIERVTFELSERDSYFRIRVEDFDGNRAFTQAYKI